MTVLVYKGMNKLIYQERLKVVVLLYYIKTLYDTCDMDLFQSLENSLCKYKDGGEIYVVGDFNANTSEIIDYISDVKLPQNIINSSTLLQYENDVGK